jgi:hypothetical protein
MSTGLVRMTSKKRKAEPLANQQLDTKRVKLTRHIETEHRVKKSSTNADDIKLEDRSTVGIGAYVQALVQRIGKLAPGIGKIVSGYAKFMDTMDPSPLDSRLQYPSKFSLCHNEFVISWTSDSFQTGVHQFSWKHGSEHDMVIGVHHDR